MDRKLCHQTVSRGFTLIEVLIALAITSMVVSVLMSSVFYGTKVQLSIRQELVEREQFLRSKAWFSELLGSCLPADAASGSAFEGEGQEITCESLMPLQGRKFTTSQRIRLSLRADAKQNHQMVYYQPSTAEVGQIIAEFSGGTTSFVFVGTDGVEVTKWPVMSNDPETLPRRIQLKIKGSTGERTDFEWSTSVRASPWLEPVLKKPFGLDLPR